MMGHRNLSKSFALTAALLMALCAFAVFAVDNSDAESVIVSNIDASGFKQDQKGTLTFTVTGCTQGDVLHFTVNEGDKELTTSEKVATSEDYVVSLSFKLSKGTHSLNIEGTNITNGDVYSGNVTVESADNIWSHVTSYIVLVIVVIVIIVIAVLYIRAKPNNKPTTTFTQLEEEKKAARAESKPSAPAKTEKVKYTSSRRK